MRIVSELKIKLFADSANQKELIKHSHDPLIKGFTTNPSLMRQAGVTNYKAFALDVLKTIQNKPIAFEVFADEFSEMEEQAYQIASWGKNVIVKIPVTNTQGIFAGELIKKLSHDGIALNITAVFTLEQVQAVVACLSKETPAIISVFAGRIADTGIDPLPLLKQALRILQDFSNIELLWASPRELFNVVQANDMGCHIITLTDALLKKMHLLEKELSDYSLDTVKMFYKDAITAGYSIAPLAARRLNTKVLSILMASKDPQSLQEFLNNIQQTIENPNSVEVLIKIDIDDEAMRVFLDNAATSYAFTIRYIQTPRLEGQYSLHLAYQQLFEIANKSSYFFQMLNEEVRFKTKGWDALLVGYMGFFPEDVFRLKLSQLKFRNYYRFHDCGLAPDKFSLMTRKWMELAGGVGDSWTVEAWHQSIEYHLGQIEGINGIPGIFRSVPVTDIILEGENTGLALNAEQAETHAYRVTQEQWRLYGSKVQQEFRRRATHILAHIWAKNERFENFSIKQNDIEMELTLVDDATGQIQRGFYYYISPLYIKFQNFFFLTKMVRVKSVRFQKAFVEPIDGFRRGARGRMNMLFRQCMLQLAKLVSTILPRSESIPKKD